MTKAKCPCGDGQRARERGYEPGEGYCTECSCGRAPDPVRPGNVVRHDLCRCGHCRSSHVLVRCLMCDCTGWLLREKAAY